MFKQNYRKKVFLNLNDVAISFFDFISKKEAFQTNIKSFFQSKSTKKYAFHFY